MSDRDRSLKAQKLNINKNKFYKFLQVLFYLFLLYLGYVLAVYKFSNPKLTETELLMDTITLKPFYQVEKGDDNND